MLGEYRRAVPRHWLLVRGTGDRPLAGDPENEPGQSRWGWRFAIRPLLVLDDLRDAPPVEAAGVFPRSLGPHSYVRLTPEQYDAAREALILAGGAER